MTCVALCWAGLNFLMAVDTLPVEGIGSFGNIGVFTLSFMTLKAGLSLCFPCFEGMMAICAGKCVAGFDRVGLVVE